MSYATIDELRSQLGKTPTASGVTQQYAAKMLHKIPTGTVVDRSAFILERCKGKRVLEFGASGPLQSALMAAASDYWGVDREHGPGGWQQSHIVGFDLDDVGKRGLPYGHYEAPDDLPGSELVTLERPEVIVCGEVLEHLTNPGHFLQRLWSQYSEIPIIITVPNAFSTAGKHYLAKGLENVNIDHVAWYSPRTLWTLLERYHFSIEEFHWYNGEPLTAEGMIVVARA